MTRKKASVRTPPSNEKVVFDFAQDEHGHYMVTVTFTEATMDHLDRLATLGIYGIGIEGVVEGLVYRGLQEICSLRRKDLEP